MQQGNIKKALDNLYNAGYRLRCAREYLGLSEKEVADELKLMVSHVRAIEQNRSEYLVQRKPFERYLRAYARLVQLSPDTIVDMYFAKSAPEPAQPVDITTRLEIPPQPVVTPPFASRWQFAGTNYYHPAILGTGFVVIGLSLFAGWGVKQLVGGQQDRPVLAQNDLLEVRASTRRQPVVAVAQPELTDIRFEKPVTSVPPISSAELEPIEVAATERVVAEGSIDRSTELPVSTSTLAVAEPSAVDLKELSALDLNEPSALDLNEPVENIELQDFTVQVKKRPIVALTTATTATTTPIAEKPAVNVASKAVSKKPTTKAAPKAINEQPPAVTDTVIASSKTKRIVPATLSAATGTTATTASLASSLPLAAPTPTKLTPAKKAKVSTNKSVKAAKLAKATPPKTQAAEVKPIALAETAVVGDERAAKGGAIASKPVLKPAIISSARKSDRESNRKIDGSNAKQLVSQKSSELNGLRELGEKSNGQSTTNVAVGVGAAEQSLATLLQPQKVISKKLIAAPQTKVQESPEAEDLQQVVAARSEPMSLATATPLSGSVTINSDVGLGFGPDLDDEASDLDAVINAGATEDAQPFEVALSNSSDSASVARLALLESYKSTLRRRVYENVTYPGRARRRNQEGKVIMNATVNRAGELLSVEMAEASKYDALNRASEKAIKQSSPFPAAPDTLSGDAFLLTVPVVFKVPSR